MWLDVYACRWCGCGCASESQSFHLHMCRWSRHLSANTGLLLLLFKDTCMMCQLQCGLPTTCCVLCCAVLCLAPHRVTHSIPLPPLAAGPPPQAAAQVQPPSSAAAAGAEAGGIGGGAPARERKKRPAADSPLSGGLPGPPRLSPPSAKTVLTAYSLTHSLLFSQHSLPASPSLTQNTHSLSITHSLTCPLSQPLHCQAHGGASSACWTPLCVARGQIWRELTLTPRRHRRGAELN